MTSVPPAQPPASASDPGDANTGSILRSDRQRDHDLGHPSLVDCDGDALGPGEACGRGPAERACPGCGWRTRDVEREGHVCLTPAQPLTAPESEVRLTEAERVALDVAVGALGSEDYPGVLFDEVERIVAERVRVVEGERDEYKRGWVEADVRADYAEARAESAEAAHEALRAGIEALADEWDKNAAADMDVESKTLRSVATYLRALLAGGEER